MYNYAKHPNADWTKKRWPHVDPDSKLFTYLCNLEGHNVQQYEQYKQEKNG